MHNRDLIDTIRRVGQFATNDPIYTDKAILAEATQALRDRFAAPLQQCRQGYWLHSVDLKTSLGKDRYKIPANTVVQGLEKVEIDPGPGWRELRILTQGQASAFASDSADVPAHFSLESDQVRLWPPPADVFGLRMTFYLQPPELVLFETEESAGGGGSPLAAYPDGLCRVVSTTANTVIVTSNPEALNYPITVNTGFYIQNYNGSHEVPCFDGVVDSFSGPDVDGNYTITAAAPYSGRAQIQVGDFVRPAGKSVYPMLPEELHRPLADYTAGIIWGSKGDRDKLSSLTQKAEGGVNRFVEMAVSRVKTRPFVWRRTNSYLRNTIG